MICLLSSYVWLLFYYCSPFAKLHQPPLDGPIRKYNQKMWYVGRFYRDAWISCLRSFFCSILAFVLHFLTISAAYFLWYVLLSCELNKSTELDGSWFWFEIASIDITLQFQWHFIGSCVGYLVTSWYILLCTLCVSSSSSSHFTNCTVDKLCPSFPQLERISKMPQHPLI